MIDSEPTSRRRWLRRVPPYVGTAALTVAAFLGYRAVQSARLVEEGRLPPAIEGCELAGEGGRLRCLAPTVSPEHPAELVIWFEDEDLPQEGIEVTLHSAWSDRALAAEHNPLWSRGAERDGGGTQLAIEVPAEGVLEIVASTQTETRAWVVEVESRPATPRLDAAAEKWDGGAGEAPANEVLEDLQGVIDGSEGEWAAARALELRADVLEYGDADDRDAALVAYEDALARAGDAELSLRCRLLRKLGHSYEIRGDHDAAADTAARMSECDALGLAHRHPQALNEGKAQLHQGRYAEAIQRLWEAIHGARRMQAREVELSAFASLATTFARTQQLDQAEWALARANALAVEIDADCAARAALAGHTAALAIDRRLGRWPSETSPSQTLRDVLGSTCRIPEVVRTHLVLQLAYAEQLWGRPDEAAQWLDRLSGSARSPMLQKYEASIRADIAIGRRDEPGMVKAHATLARLLDEHPDAADEELLVQRDVVAAHIALYRDELEAAETLLRRALVRQEGLLRLVPLGLSASRVSAREAEPARLLVEVQRKRAHHEDAWCTARLLRNRDARLLMDAARLAAADPARHARLVDDVRSAEAKYQELQTEGAGSPHELAAARRAIVSAKEALDLALIQTSGARSFELEALCDTLPAPAEGELSMLFHQDPQQRWWMFEQLGDGPVRIHDVGEPIPLDRAEAATRYLSPVRDRLAEATRVRLLTSGATHEITFEALPWAGSTLEHGFIVTWGQDLPHAPVPVDSTDGPPRRVMVYTDPLLQQKSPVKAPMVEALLTGLERTWGFDVAHITDERSSIADVLAVAPGAFVVFIGENGSLGSLDVDNPRCPDPKTTPALDDPGRPLAGIAVNWTTYDLGTILTSAPPRAAVLESCATGPIDGASLGGAIGLGHALVAAGARQVLVTRTKVCTGESFGFVTELVEATTEHGYDLPSILRSIRDEVDPYYEHRVLAP